MDGGTCGAYNRLQISNNVPTNNDDVYKFHPVKFQSGGAITPAGNEPATFACRVAMT